MCRPDPLGTAILVAQNRLLQAPKLRKPTQAPNGSVAGISALAAVQIVEHRVPVVGTEREQHLQAVGGCGLAPRDFPC